MAQGLPQTQATFEPFRLAPESTGRIVDAVNHTVGDEASLKSRIAVVRRGERLTDRLSITQETGWFQPMLSDLLRQGVSVVVNDIPITEAIARDIGRAAELPSDWVTQQNLYITPGDSQGFDPHCDPHVVVVAHLYGRKTWTIYEKTLDNPVYDAETATIADKHEQLPVRATVTVEPGDCFVIPRGAYHSAIALTPASIHLAIGVAGVRPVDYIWSLAESAMRKPELRADLSPEAAMSAAQDFIGGYAFQPASLPRFARTEPPSHPGDGRFIFQDVIDALPGD